jgi:hypothetical protein
MVKAARVMATARKRAIATNSNNMGNCYNKEAGGQATAAAMGMGMGMVQRTWPLTLGLERRV